MLTVFERLNSAGKYKHQKWTDTHLGAQLNFYDLHFFRRWRPFNNERGKWTLRQQLILLQIGVQIIFFAAIQNHFYWMTLEPFLPLKSGELYLLSICIKRLMSLFHARTAGPISTQFHTRGLRTNSGKVLNTRQTPSTQTRDPGVPQTLKPKQITGEKTV